MSGRANVGFNASNNKCTVEYGYGMVNPECYDELKNVGSNQQQIVFTVKDSEGRKRVAESNYFPAGAVRVKSKQKKSDHFIVELNNPQKIDLYFS